MRLNKYLAECDVASRRKAEELISEGRISVNGKVIRELVFFVNESKDTVRVDNRKLKIKEKEYYLLYKPKGVITTTNDDKGRITVINLINTKSVIFPVGRLDYNTTGILLLTNDGDFANYLLHPTNKFQREYIAKLDKPLKLADMNKLLQGIYIDKRKSKFIDIKIKSKEYPKRVNVITEEGRNHFVKVMFSKVGYRVNELKRIRFGIFTLGKLIPGQYRKLTNEEIISIKNLYEKN
ncbi:MAG: rRNA pseudouridine synthase [Ignavibacteriales bacterium]|nr:rRNA pseudouridine synthase [Ignavibacteriales bacterium]